MGKEDVENEEDRGGGTDVEAEWKNEEDQGGSIDNAVEREHEEDSDEGGKDYGREVNGEDGVDEVVREVHTVEEDRLFGQKVGYPTTRRPVNYLRALSTDPWETVFEWFSTFKVTIGPKAEAAMKSKDEATAEKTARLFYTWRDLFVEDMVAMLATDLVTHTIPTRAGAIPRRAKDKLYTPREREWMDRNIPKMLEAGIIDYSVSPWCHRTKFVPKKDGDLRMVHVYVPINAATVANSYPMCRIELVLNSLMQPGLGVYF